MLKTITDKTFKGKNFVKLKNKQSYYDKSLPTKIEEVNYLLNYRLSSYIYYNDNERLFVLLRELQIRIAVLLQLRGLTSKNFYKIKTQLLTFPFSPYVNDEHMEKIFVKIMEKLKKWSSKNSVKTRYYVFSKVTRFY
jgi:hypothetical protein